MNLNVTSVLIQATVAKKFKKNNLHFIIKIIFNFILSLKLRKIQQASIEIFMIGHTHRSQQHLSRLTPLFPQDR